MKNPFSGSMSIALVISLVVFFGCKDLDKGVDASESKKFNISEIQQAYELNLKSGRTKSTNKATQAKQYKNVKWGNYYAVKKEGELKLIFPFQLETEIYKKMENGLTLPYSALSRLIVSKKDGLYDYEIVTKHVDPEFKDSGNPEDFRGFVVVEDIHGNFIKGFRYTEDGVKLLTQEEKNTRTTERICQYVDWYSCSIRTIDGIPIYEYCQPMYSDLVGCVDVQDQDQDKFIQIDGNWYFNFNLSSGGLPQEIRIVGVSPAPLDRICSASFNFSGNQNTSSNYTTTLWGSKFEDGSTINTDQGGQQFSCANGITDAAMNLKQGMFDWLGLGITPLEYISRNFAYLQGSGDIKRVYDTDEQQFVWNFSPLAAKVISAHAINVAAQAVGESSFGSAATPGNSEVFRNLAEVANKILRSYMPGSSVRWTRFGSGTTSNANYAPNCK
ncbi:hypothetical protein CLV98_1371 [Dyadobacter jejuensis]|uniref:WG repeat protein n=1 Tax=Dyadobacter jejuensis TaxID=1082580 RepID=A0A316AP14_9BACT|nr:hypothetical protein [Dyadobacter jejuensis]PWJ51827.1 hypothetical protein CLV98_1371 [Dyadobacter jejuensis]